MADEVIDLVRRFEPILIFHHLEQSIPSDAKRYIERCALWKAERPFDQKDSWGGKGHPFNRKPLIARGKIAASNTPGEIRTGDIYLGAQQGSVFPFLIDNGEQHFLELAGWKDSADITETSENRYANRDKVEELYRTNDDLRDSQLWYHAELFDTQRLRRLMVPQEPSLVPDLSNLFKELAPRNPALLCYYFFFPSHTESLPEPCDLQETGKEYGGFVGEWACMAILLERESESKPYLPKFIGHTGRFNVGTRQGLDSERRFGMTVDKWREKTDAHAVLLPETVGDHPQLFVSLGVHSLHLQPGTHIIEPYLPESSPVGCGRFDSPDALSEYRDSLPAKDEEGSPAAAWGKIVGGLFLGALPGLVAGAVLTALEGLPLGTGFTGVATGSAPPEKPAADVGPEPTAFDHLILQPKDLNLSQDDFPNASILHWNNDQNIEIKGRHYDFIVDRSTQIWWPSDDGKSGYRGRWGPLVANDPYRRRSGMRFAEFWKMFFVALAKNQ
ncbi:MAG: hypothetical protein WAU91_13115 [Desulfatitalea sp.]